MKNFQVKANVVTAIKNMVGVKVTKGYNVVAVHSGILSKGEEKILTDVQGILANVDRNRGINCMNDV